MKFVYMDFPNGEVWRVPAKYIAEDRAKYYAEKDYPDDVERQKEAKAVEVDYALNNQSELADWLRNNMHAEDVKSVARRIQGPQDADWGDFYNAADLRFEEVDPNDDPDKPDGIPRGIYMLADTPTTRIPILTEAGDGDHNLLREAIEESDVEGIFVTNPSNEDVVDYLLEYIDDSDSAGKRASGDANGASFVATIEAATEEYSPVATIDALRNLLATGRVYMPSKSTLRTTGYEPGGGE